LTTQISYIQFIEFAKLKVEFKAYLIVKSSKI